MTHKQRFEKAMRHEPTDKVAAMEIEFQISESYVGQRLIVGVEYAALSAAEKTQALALNAETMLAVAIKADHDVIRSIGGYWEVAPGVPAMLWLPEREDQLEQLRVLKKLTGDEYYILGTTGTCIGIPDGEHIYEFVDRLYDSPEELHIALMRQLEDGIAWHHRQVEAGADTAINAVDVAINTGTFLSIAQMDEFFFPYFNRWTEALKASGQLSLWHTDGNLMGIMDRIISSGVDAIQCVDPLGGMDIVALHRELCGQLSLIGNIDCGLLQFGPADKIAAETRRVVEGCKGGGFALSCCNAVFPEIPAEHYQAMVDAKARFG